MPETLSIRKTITTYPMLFGPFLGLLLLIGIWSMVIWAPWIGDARDRHNKLVQGVFCTTFNFAIFINVLWAGDAEALFGSRWPSYSCFTS